MNAPRSLIVSILIVLVLLLPAASTGARTARPELELTTAGICTVTSKNDSGPGTLRDCLSKAVSGDTITFSTTVFPPANPGVIALTSALPDVSQGNLTIDASNAGVILDGSGTHAGSNGLHIPSNGNVIRGLQILRFPQNGLCIDWGARDNTIGGDRGIGSGPTGQGNLISGNSRDGVLLTGTGTGNNKIAGNYIGTDAGGTSALPNGRNGVEIVGGAPQNTVGGPTPAERNVISSNHFYGIRISDEGTDGNVVIGNYIGVDATGGVALGGINGLVIAYAAEHNRIGGATPGERNVISGNDCFGVGLIKSGTAENVVVGNYIGTNASGTAAIGNGCQGVWIEGGPQRNRIGGSTPGERNVISGNAWDGVTIQSSSTMSNSVAGNYIGISASGTMTVPNGANGVSISSGASYNTVGGATAGERNVISGNQNGVQISGGPGTDYNEVLGNYIGLSPAGTTVIGAGDRGVYVWEKAKHNRVESNLISGAQTGIWIGQSETTDNLVAHNYVGTDFTRTMTWGNTNGIGVGEGAQRNVIGPGNVVAFNDFGIYTYQPTTLQIRITQNSVFSNTNTGIGNYNGGNTELAAPVITQILAGRTAVGTTCAGCTVEVFSDADGQGRVYEGTTAANGNGQFSFTAPCGLSGPNVTATSADASGNTSVFSSPASRGAAPVRCVFLPALLKN